MNVRRVVSAESQRQTAVERVRWTLWSVELRRGCARALGGDYDMAADMDRDAAELEACMILVASLTVGGQLDALIMATRLPPARVGPVVDRLRAAGRFGPRGEVQLAWDTRAWRESMRARFYDDVGVACGLEARSKAGRIR